MFPNESGLSNEEVKIRQEKYGPNILPEKPPPSDIALLFSQFKNPLILVLFIAGGVTLFIKHFSDAVVIFLAVFINTILGFLQERKASKALHALKSYVTHSVVAFRNGERASVGTDTLVPGDIVVLGQGTKIPADGKLVSANRVYVDEAILTGESSAVRKDEGAPVFMGTIISSGRAIMEVESIGVNTKMGKIALQIQEVEGDTPLQKQLAFFSKQLLVLVFALISSVFLIGLLRNYSVTEMFVTSVALAVSSIPEGLIVSLTVVLAIGMHRILKRGGLVRKLAAAETLGGVTVICIDKTGTLTQGKMSVVGSYGNEVELLEQVTVANDLDDPIVISAFEWGKNKLADNLYEYQRLDSIPFSPQERFFISLHKISDSTSRIYVNGAPELLLDWVDMPSEQKKETLSLIEELSGQGKRLIGFARKDVSADKVTLSAQDAKEKLAWVGILAFTDPVRDGVKKALSKALRAGIRNIVITGDYAKTSQSVLSFLGMDLSPEQIVTGEQLRELGADALRERVNSAVLFARTTPDQKLLIVKALKENGEVVAMMGDGVNDAPALHAADIGIAVGEATDVSKESADLILLDSDFATILAAVEEGRGMFDNIRKIILYLLSDSFGEIVIVLGGMLIGLPLPISALQILWINLVSDGFPNLALTVDPKSVGIMKEKPRSPKEKLVNGWMVCLICIVSAVAGLMALAAFIVTLKITNSITAARSMAFLTLGLNSLAYVFSVKTLLVPFWKARPLENKWLILAVFAGLGLQFFPFSTNSTRQFFGLENLSIYYWLIGMGLSVAVFFIVEMFKSFYHRFWENK